MTDPVKSLREQVKKGSISAALQLAEGFRWGTFGESDPKRAAAMYRICCRSQNQKIASLGFYQLGNLYYHGYLTNQEQKEEGLRRAFSCYLKSVMLSPNPNALRKLGDMYRYGQGVTRNERLALSLYLKAGQEA